MTRLRRALYVIATVCDRIANRVSPAPSRPGLWLETTDSRGRDASPVVSSAGSSSAVGVRQRGPRRGAPRRLP